MRNTLLGERAPAPPAPDSEPRRPDLIDWLTSGRLTLVDERQQTVSPEAWAALPVNVQANARADFDRIVRGRAKAAVLFLRG